MYNHRIGRREKEGRREEEREGGRREREGRREERKETPNHTPTQT